MLPSFASYDPALNAPALSELALLNSTTTPPQDGVHTEYYPTGSIKKIEHYEHGQLMGLCRGFYENGQLAYEIPYEHDLCSGLARSFYPSGQLKCEQALSYDDHGRSCGYVRTYYDNGKLASSSLHQHGHITTKQFYPSGAPLLCTTVIDGLTEGTTTWYYPSGAVQRTIPFSHSLIEGEACEYYEDGTIACSVSYRHDLRHGPECRYDHAGQLLTTRYFDQGKLTAPE